MQELLVDESAMVLAQKLASSPKLVYTIKNDVYPIVSSKRTAYRRLRILDSFGIIKRKHGNFLMNTILGLQPMTLVQKIIPSLLALKKGKRFGMHYNDYDIKFATSIIDDGFITLDYKAWELTKFQYPNDLYVYTKEFDNTIANLKDRGFSEGKKGHVVILPTIGDFKNEIERVYLDSIAKGGRSIQDAIAIELLYKEHLTIKANFSVEQVIKVQEDMPANRYATPTVR